VWVNGQRPRMGQAPGRPRGPALHGAVERVRRLPAARSSAGDLRQPRARPHPSVL
jgi:hypothetical protein